MGKMNQGTRYVRRKCIDCGKDVKVVQIYNRHYSDWEDVETMPICDDCKEDERLRYLRE